MLECEIALVPIVLLFTLTLLAFLFSVSGLVLSAAKGYVGFLMDESLTYTCSLYLTSKLQIGRISIFNAIFIGTLVVVVCQLLLFLQCLYLLVKLCKTEDKFLRQFNQGTFVRLYVGYSVALLGQMIGVGYYVSYIVEMGINCLGSVNMDWVVFLVLLILALVLLLICWIFLFVFRLRTMKCFQEDEVMNEKKGFVPQDKKENNYGDGSKGKDNVGNKKPDIFRDYPVEQPYYMNYLYQQLQKQRANAETNEIREPLIEVQPDDLYVQQDETNKQQYKEISFEEFQRKKELQKLKDKQNVRKVEEKNNQKNNGENNQHSYSPGDQKLEHKQGDTINGQKMKDEIHQNHVHNSNQPDTNGENHHHKPKPKKNKEKLNKIPLSPDDPNFDLIFLQSEKEDSESESESKVEVILQPKSHSSAASKQNQKPLKHPQNLTGGRSKKAMMKYLAAAKRPPRNQETYRAALGTALDKQRVSPKNSPKESSFRSLSFKDDSFHIEPHQYEDQLNTSGRFRQNNTPKSVLIVPPPRPFNVEQVVELDNQPDVLYFHKSKVTERKKKRLFNEPKKSEDLSMEKVLTTLVKGIEQKSNHNRLRQIRERRNSHLSGYKGAKGQKLIDSIRSTYE